MAIALVQQKTSAATSGTSTSPTLGATPAAGSLMVVTQIGNAGNISGVSGYGVTTWALAKTAGFTYFAAEIWYGIVDTTPATTGTVTFAGDTYYGVSLSEWSGISSSGTLLAQNDNDSGTGTSSSTGPITGSASPCLYISVLSLSSGRTASSPTGSFTGLDVANAGNVMRNYSAYRIDSTAASATSGWTISASTEWEMSMAAFKGTADATVRRGLLLGIG